MDKRYVGGQCIDDFPEEWKCNKNLRWWLAHNEREILDCGDIFYVCEYHAVEFAKQYQEKQISQLKSENKELKKEIKKLEEALDITDPIDRLAAAGRL